MYKLNSNQSHLQKSFTDFPLVQYTQEEERKAEHQASVFIKETKDTLWAHNLKGARLERAKMSYLAQHALASLCGLKVKQELGEGYNNGVQFEHTSSTATLSIYVKARTQDNDLLLPFYQYTAGQAAHIYVLAYVGLETRQIRFKGWCKQQEIDPKKTVLLRPQFGEVDRCIIKPAKELHPMLTLWALMKLYTRFT